MPWVGFDLTIPVFEWAKTFHALGVATTVIGGLTYNLLQTLPEAIQEAYLMYACITNKSTETYSYPQIRQSSLKLDCLSLGTETRPTLYIAYCGSGKWNKIKNSCLKYLGLAMLLWVGKQTTLISQKSVIFLPTLGIKLLNLFGAVASAQVHKTLTSEHKWNRKLPT
jgi:hypothetical protein